MLYGLVPQDTPQTSKDKLNANKAYEKEGTDLDLVYTRLMVQLEAKREEEQRKQEQSSPESVTKSLASLHLQDIDADVGLSAALSVSDNGHFDLLPVSEGRVM